MESLDQHIGRTVHGILWERRITQRRLAAELGLDETMVSKMLRGVRSWSIAELLRTAAFLELPVTDLLPSGAWTADPIQATARYPDSDDQPALPGLDALIPFPRKGGWAAAA